MRFDSLTFRQLLGRLVSVCQAVAYAHSRGVLHRDIKPGNVMLGKYGETLVVDWGLAKVIGRPDAGEAAPGEEGLLRPSSGGGAQATQGAVGTPAFMSPEQAAGKVAELGPATDTYSLGATLYELLTNRAPFKGPVVEVIKQVEKGAWQPACQVNAAVPPALDAICRKAMALRPEERYGSALALAEDLEHWLADEPVGAYQEPAWARLRRWMRKHPRRVNAAAASLVAAVVVLAVSAVVLESSRQATQRSLDTVQEQADYFVSEVSDNLLLNEPGLQPLRRRILMKTVEGYAKFLKDRPGDPHARQQLAGAKRQLGELCAQMSQLREARAYEIQAVEDYEALLQQTPTDRGSLFGLARARYVIADLHAQEGKSEEGTKEVERSIALLKTLTTEEPGNVAYLLLLARCYEFRTTTEAQQGNVESGLADNERVLETLGKAGVRNPAHTHWSAPGWEGPRVVDHGQTTPQAMAWPRDLMLGRAYTTQGTLLSMAGRNSEAVRFLEEAIAIHRPLLKQNPRAGQVSHGLALALLHSGRVLVQLDMPGRGEVALREALGLMQRLVQDDPQVKEYRATRLLAAGYLGDSLFRQGRTAAAAELLREVVQEGDKELDRSCKDHNVRGQHARLLSVLGRLEVEAGNFDRGLDICRMAQEKLEQALRETSGDRSLRSDWLANRETLARCRFLKEEFSRDDWIAEQRAILKERQALVSQGPPAPQFQGEVAGSAVILAGLLLEANQPAEALACVDEALPGQEQLVRDEQERVKKAVKEQQEAGQGPLKPDRDQSIQFYLQRTAIVPDNALHRQWALLLARRGAALARLGRGAEAVEAVQQAVRITAGILSGNRPVQFPPASPAALWTFLPTLLWPLETCDLYDLACHLALASTLPGANGRPDAAEQAVAALRCCIASGFDNLHQLRTDPALEPLRKREDFQKLVHALEASRPGRKDATANP